MTLPSCSPRSERRLGPMSPGASPMRSKNPLTPIQLAAERLKRKYLSQVRQDPDTFESLTETIIRQVADIGRMVDEFSAFARMPTAVIGETDLAALLREQVALQETAHPAIRYELSLPAGVVSLHCDARQIRQATTNLLQNAADSIESRGGATPPAPGWIGVQVTLDDQFAKIAISDNGIGLPARDRHRLTEPYVTTREKGTGLGLAIVMKIMEDHKGEVQILDREGGGALAVMEIPIALDNSTGDLKPAEESKT